MEKIPSQQSPSPAQKTHDISTPCVYTENGVYMTEIQHNGQKYRLGATTPRFMQELTSVPMQPSAEDVEALRAKGLWLEADTLLGQGPKVAITCGGVGSVWPGMGRALYDTFPAAREVMDRLAAVASWDILSLMDETDMEKIQCTRWQMPYLFFVEYAQAAYLQSLGFAPHLMSGHSLGELIGLCLAGTYSPEIAWQIFDRRAVYIDGLERDATDGMGMMAVYGSYEKVQKILEIFPELHISNHNTPTQFMLGGKKEMLAEARRILRKEKCPALTLPINMAFHHPHLRVLRQSAVEGLLGLPTMVPTMPVLSNVTAGLYPTDKEGIVQYIADLDENTVRWVDCVRTMWDRFDIRHFVEFGSADNICGLVKEIEPRAVCIPVSLKNAEVQTMRAAVAQLYALGHIPVKNLTAVTQSSYDHASERASEQASENTYANACEQVDVKEATVQVDAPSIPAHVQDILPILAEAADKAVEILRPHMDLRHELALRSNRFPSIMMKVEQRFGIRLRIEDVLHVATILDLANVVAGLRAKQGEEGFVFEESAQAHGTGQEVQPMTARDVLPSLQCLRGMSSAKGAAFQWEAMPWPSVLCERVEKKTVLVLCAAKGQELFAALDTLATSACRMIFYAPPVAFAHAPSQATQERLQALGAHVEVHTQEEFSEELHIHTVLHLVEGAVLQELTSPSDTPLLRAFEKNILEKATVGSVLTLLSAQGTGGGAAFTAQPAMESIEKFWQHWTQKQQIEKNISCSVRMLHIPLVLCAQDFTPQKAQNAMSAQELALYFARWFWCAKESYGLWQRAENTLATLQENMSWQGQMFTESYALAPVENEQGAYVERIQSHCHFSAYVMPWTPSLTSITAPPAAPSMAPSMKSSERAPGLTTEHFLSALYAGVTLPFPWLSCVGMDAVEFLPQAVSAITQGPEGVTREGRLETYGNLWEPREQKFAARAGQECSVELSLRALSAEGRAQDLWQKAAGARMLLVAQSASPQALWEGQEQGAAQIVEKHATCELQGAWKDPQEGKKFAKKDALRYIGVSKLLELLQKSVQAERCPAKHLTLQSIEQLRWCSSLLGRETEKKQETTASSAEIVCGQSGLAVTLQWQVLLEEAQGLNLSAQILCPKGTVLLTAKNISFIL